VARIETVSPTNEELRPPRVSVVIPTLYGNVDGVVESIRRQTFTDFEIHVVAGVRPAARARNIGVAETSGALVVFVDDDARLGHDRVLETLVQVAESDTSLGVVGPSKILSPRATPLQRRIGTEVPRWQFPVVESDLESNPPIDRYGYTGITTTCCLVPRQVFEEIGGFDERFTTGEDTEFFFQVRRAGYRFLVPAHTWVYHDPPRRLTGFLKRMFVYGENHAWEARKAPERHMDLIPMSRWYGKLFAAVSPLLFLPSLFINVYFDPTRHVKVGFRPMKALSTYATFLGYVWGSFRRNS
jgi:GT2 family glycosyltransferase